MTIGSKIQNIRLKYGLTQKELADRAELSKGFISQLERDLTSPSIATLTDILECLGTTPGEFFGELESPKVVYHEEEMFEKTSDQNSVVWLIPSAQKNLLEPIIITIEPMGSSEHDNPHPGEEFGYVLSGSGFLHIGENSYKLKKGCSFYFATTEVHHIENTSNRPLKVLWVSSPPNF